MSPFPPAEAEQLGQRLYTQGFRPLPDVNDDGALIGTILWRQNGQHVEYLALRTDGFALAMRAEASFNYRAPHLHGSVLGHHTGDARDALTWLLATTARSARQGQHHRLDEGRDRP